jgi:hypothetical protein
VKKGAKAMFRSVLDLCLGAALVAALIAPSLAQAGDGSNPGDREMTAPGIDRMRHGDRMMDHCMQMMRGNAARPNEQWRDDSLGNTPPKDGK